MVEELLDKIRNLPKTTQRIILALGLIASIASLLSALVDWEDAARPGFIGGLLAMLIKDIINYLLGNRKETVGRRPIRKSRPGDVNAGDNRDSRGG
jgi:hypothetical protein